MDSAVTEARSEADERFDTVRITAAVNALAEQHTGREDQFRAAVAQLLKAELIAARATAPAGAARSGCASCRTRSSASSTRPRPGISITRRYPPAPSAWRWLRPAAT